MSFSKKAFYGWGDAGSGRLNNYPRYYMFHFLSTISFCHGFQIKASDTTDGFLREIFSTLVKSSLLQKAIHDGEFGIWVPDSKARLWGLNYIMYVKYLEGTSHIMLSLHMDSGSGTHHPGKCNNNGTNQGFWETWVWIGCCLTLGRRPLGVLLATSKRLLFSNTLYQREFSEIHRSSPVRVGQSR